MNGEIKKKGLSTGAKWGIGCGSGCLVTIVLLIVVGIFAFRFARNKLAEMTGEMKQYGFEKVVTGQLQEVRDTITEPTLYTGQSVKILGDCTTNLAILAQMAEIHGRVDGKVYFRGQVLIVQPNARLLGGIDAKCQAIQKYGAIEGDITGAYQMLDDKTIKP